MFFNPEEILRKNKAFQDILLQTAVNQCLQAYRKIRVLLSLKSSCSLASVKEVMKSMFSVKSGSESREGNTDGQTFAVWIQDLFNVLWISRSWVTSILKLSTKSTFQRPNSKVYYLYCQYVSFAIINIFSPLICIC